MVRRRVYAGDRVPSQRYIAGVGGITHLQEGKKINVVLSEAVEVLEEELQLLTGERLVVSVVSHVLTIRPVCICDCGWVAPRGSPSASRRLGCSAQ